MILDTPWPISLDGFESWPSSRDFSFAPRCSVRRSVLASGRALLPFRLASIDLRFGNGEHARSELAEPIQFGSLRRIRRFWDQFFSCHVSSWVLSG
jgi:hypothetical protein